MTVAQAYKLFLRDRAGYCAEKTLVTYSGHLGLFFDWLEQVYKSIDQLTFEEIPPEDNIFSDYILFLRNRRNVSNTTIRSYSRSVKAFLNYYNLSES